MANGVYWVGADNNIYTKEAGQTGVRNVGKALKTYSTGYDSALQSEQGLRRISDPMAVNNKESAIEKELEKSNARYKALEAQLAAQPKLPFYNTTQAWATAQKQAASHVNPVYVDKLNAYLKKEHAGISQQKEQNTLDKQTIAQTLADTLAGINTSRGAAKENQENSLADVATNETHYQADEGTQFDRARAALLGQIANAGLATSGLGRQQEYNSITDRNQASKEQEEAFASKRRDINALANQTLADLSNKETSAQHVSEANTKQSDKNLRDYIENAHLDENQFRTQNELDRDAAIARETGNYYDTNLAKFIQGLINSGARSQDIALAQQVYG